MRELSVLCQIDKCPREWGYISVRSALGLLLYGNVLDNE